MFKFKMLAVDMDGTLLNDNLQVSVKNKYAINYLIENGIKIILTTGRTFRAARYYAKDIAGDLPIISYNGGLIRRASSEETLYLSKIEREPVKELLKYSEKINIYTKVYIDDILYVAEKSEEAEVFSVNHRITYKVVGKLSGKINERPNMVVFIDTSDKIGRMTEGYLKDNRTLSYTSSTVHSLEVMAPKVSKAYALERLCSHLNIKREEVLAAGNSMNDLDMLKWSGTGVAMKNSDPELLKRYNIVSGHTNNEDGIYHIAKDFGLI